MVAGSRLPSVPDFLARPWDSTEADVPPAIHVLAACTSCGTRKTTGPIPIPSVVVLSGTAPWMFNKNINAAVCGQ